MVFMLVVAKSAWTETEMSILQNSRHSPDLLDEFVRLAAGVWLGEVLGHGGEGGELAHAAAVLLLEAAPIRDQYIEMN